MCVEASTDIFIISCNIDLVNALTLENSGVFGCVAQLSADPTDVSNASAIVSRLRCDGVADERLLPLPPLSLA
jgi:hypothetical protein